MGPQKGEEVRISRLDRIEMQVKKMVSVYFNEPLHYLFYTALFAATIGTFCGMHFAWQFWGILLLLGTIKTLIHFKKI